MPELPTIPLDARSVILPILDAWDEYAAWCESNPDSRFIGHGEEYGEISVVSSRVPTFLGFAAWYRERNP